MNKGNNPVSNPNDVPVYLFHQGTNYYAYDYLGCHEAIIDNKYEYSFRVWAPNADNVMLVSDFTSWDVGLQMKKIPDTGIWEIVFASSESLVGKNYKYKIWNRGNCYYKADPYAFFSETLMNTASIVWNIDGYNWNDELLPSGQFHSTGQHVCNLSSSCSFSLIPYSFLLIKSNIFSLSFLYFASSFSSNSSLYDIIKSLSTS